MKRSSLVIFLWSIVFVCCQREGELEIDDWQGEKLTMAVFGGSYSVISEANDSKKYWERQLGLKITNYGVRGAGFSVLSSENNIPAQVDRACLEDKPVYDIYLLWCSTNDVRKCSNMAGVVTDYSESDVYSLESLKTQCGGINYCIKKIREKAPEAIILFFTSSPIFTEPRYYDASYTERNGMNHFVQLQKECCQKLDMPVLDQFNDSPITIENCGIYFQKDGVHLNKDGYKALYGKQTEFLKKEIENIRKKWITRKILCHNKPNTTSGRMTILTN